MSIYKKERKMAPYLALILPRWHNFVSTSLFSRTTP